jgi:hypothetical protein
MQQKTTKIVPAKKIANYYIIIAVASETLHHCIASSVENKNKKTEQKKTHQNQLGTITRIYNDPRLSQLYYYYYNFSILYGYIDRKKHPRKIVVLQRKQK